MLSAKNLQSLVEKLNKNRNKDKRNREIMVLKAKDLDDLRASDIIKVIYNLKLKEVDFQIC
jgi:UDP-glucose 6-dehydrogenase